MISSSLVTSMKRPDLRRDMLFISSPSQSLIGRGPWQGGGAPEEGGNHLPVDRADSRPKRVCQGPRVVHVGGQDGRRACQAQDTAVVLAADRALPATPAEGTNVTFAGHSRKQRAPTARGYVYPSCRSAPRTHLCSRVGCRWFGSPEVLPRDARVSSWSACSWVPPSVLHLTTSRKAAAQEALIQQPFTSFALALPHVFHRLHRCCFPLILLGRAV